MQEFEAYVTHHSDKKKSVGNINKKFSLSFSLNIFHRDFESILLFICHGLKKKTLRLPLSYRENPIFAGKKAFQLAIVCEDKLYFYGRFLIIICNFAHRLKWCDYYSTVHFRNHHPSWLFHLIIFCSSLSFRGVWVRLQLLENRLSGIIPTSYII